MRIGSPARVHSLAATRRLPQTGDRQDNHQGAGDRQCTGTRTLRADLPPQTPAPRSRRDQHRQAVHTEEARQLRDGQDVTWL